MFTIVTYRYSEEKPSVQSVSAKYEQTPVPSLLSENEVANIIRRLLDTIAKEWERSAGDVSEVYHDGKLIGSLKR